jgi:hypothetical protein
MEKYGGNLQRKPAPPPAVARRRLRKQIAAARANPPKVDTSDITKGLPVKTAVAAHQKKLALTTKRGQKYKGPTTAGFLPDVGEGVLNAAKDFLYLPKTVVQSGYEMGAAAAEAATGDTKRARALITGVRQHDPLYLGGDALIKLAKGDSKGAAHSGRKALDEAHKHPGLTVLELYGAKGAIGKGATRVETRLTGKDPTVRPAAAFPNSPVEIPRTYSKDAFQRAGQKLNERHRVQTADARRAEAARLEQKAPGFHAERIAELRAKANAIDPRIAKPHQVKIRAARSAQVGRNVSEANQAAVAKKVRLAIKPKKGKPTAAHTLTAQQIIDGTPADLAAYRQELSLRHDTLSEAGKVANRRLQAQLDKAMKGEVDPAQLQAAADAYKAIADPLQEKLVEAGVLPKSQARKAKLTPYAVRRMEGVVPGEKGPVREQHAAAAAADAARAEHAARKVAINDKITAARAEVIKQQQEVQKGRLLTREAAIGRGLGGKVRLDDKATLKSIARHQGKLQRRTAPLARVAGHGEGLVRHDRGLAVAKQELRAAQEARRALGKPPKKVRAVVPVKAGEIEAHAAERGVPIPAFVTQRGGRAGGARGPLSKPKITGPSRTGQSTVTGQFDARPNVLVDTARNMQKLVDMAANYKSHLREFAHEPSRGKLTKAEADTLARELHARDGVEYVAVPDEPFKGDASLAQAVDSPDSHASLTAVSDALQKAYSGSAEKSGTYSIIPKAAADELRAQAAAHGPQGPVTTTLRGTSSLFRRTVLATSPSWFTGNAVEGVLRAAIAGVRPGDKALFNKAVAKIAETDPRLAQELRARVAGGGHYHSADRTTRGSVLDQYNTTRGHAAAEALQKFWAKPAPDAAATAWDKWTHFVFNNLSGRMESSIQSSMAGAAIRQGHLIDPRVPRLSQKAVDQAARGLTDTNEQAALGEKVAEMYGRYDGFTADTKYQIAMYTPFLAWWLNATNFVLHVLPKEHPTAVLLADVSEKATRDMRKELKLDELPNWLQGTIPVSGGRKLPFTRYTPFGAFNDLGESFAGSLLPQFEGVRDMLVFGRDWKGKQLYDKNGKKIGGQERALRALQVFGEATVPVYGKIKSVLTKGPGSLNPFKPIGPPKSGGTRGSSAPSAGSSTTGSGIDFSGYGGGASGIDFTGYGTGG